MQSVAADWLGCLAPPPSWRGEVLSVHRQALNILESDDRVISLVTDDSYMTALSISISTAIDGFGGQFAPRRQPLKAAARLRVESGKAIPARKDEERGDAQLCRKSLPAPPLKSPVSFCDEELRFKTFVVSLKNARIWSGTLPEAPNEAALRHLPAMKAALLEHGNREGLLGVLVPDCIANCFVRKARDIVSCTECAVKGTLIDLRGLEQLIGLGPGLTPAGDDFVTGVMLGRMMSGMRFGSCSGVARQDDPSKAGYEIIEPELGERLHATNLIGRNLLRQVLAGHFPAYLKEFDRNLREAAEDGDIESGVVAALSHGETSGSDALTGLVWWLQLVQGAATKQQS